MTDSAILEYRKAIKAWDIESYNKIAYLLVEKWSFEKADKELQLAIDGWSLQAKVNLWILFRKYIKDNNQALKWFQRSIGDWLLSDSSKIPWNIKQEKWKFLEFNDKNYLKKSYDWSNNNPWISRQPLF